MRAQGVLGQARYAALQGRDPTPQAEEAREWYARGIAKLPRLPGPHVELAELALVEARFRVALGRSPRERVAEAMARADRALELDAERADARRLRGEAELVLADWLARRGRFDPAAFDAAAASLQAAAAQEPADARSRLALARLVWRFILARDSSRTGLAGIEAPVGPRGIAYASQALGLDPALYQALAVRGALLALEPETHAEGVRQVRAALAANGNLAFEWRPWLERESGSPRSAPATGAHRKRRENDG